MARLQDVFAPFLRTPRLTLQLFDHSPEHYDCILGCMNSRTTISMRGESGIRTPAQLDAIFPRSLLRGDRFTNGIADAACFYLLRLGPDQDNGELIGLLSFCQRTNGSKVLPPDLGWALLEPYMGQGYATEAASELLRFLTEDLEYCSLIVFRSEANVKSNRVAEKLGFVDVGEIPSLRDPGKMVRLLVLPSMGESEIEALRTKSGE